jgi:hypothetical protein
LHEAYPEWAWALNSNTGKPHELYYVVAFKQLKPLQKGGSVPDPEKDRHYYSGSERMQHTWSVLRLVFELT